MIDHEVAIKVLADNWARDIETRERFLKEAKTALEVTNEHLIRVYTVAESADTNTPYIVMGLADAGTLRERIQARRLQPYTVDESLRIVREASVAVAALHDNGLLHRDLKPANILFQRTRTGAERLVLGDFGLARAIDRSAITRVSGTPAYAAPEQAAGLTQLTPQADLYALGVMFLELVTGEIPNANSSMADTAVTQIDIDAALSVQPAPVTLTPPTRTLIESLVSQNPADRPASAHDVVNTITTMLGDTHRTLEPAPTPAPTAVATVAPSPTPAPAPPPVAPASDAIAQAVPSAPGVTSGATNTDQTMFTAPLHAEVAAVPTSQSSNTARLAGIGVGVLAVIAAVVIFLVAQGGDGGDEIETAAPETTTTTEVTTTTTTTTTTVPETTTTTIGTIVATPTELIPTTFPVPGAAVLDAVESRGFTRRTYNLAGSPTSALDFYTGLDEWTVGNLVETEDELQFDVTDGADTVAVTVQRRTNTTGVELVVLQLVPADS